MSWRRQFWFRAGAVSLAGVVCLAVVAALALDRWVAATILPPLVIETSVVVEDRNGDLLRAYTVADGRWRLPAGVSDVDPRYLAMLVAYEDKRFYRHTGVDPVAMARALGQALWHGRVVSGGSTLTMQVARLLEGGGTGQWGGKFRQIRLALALERRLPKSGILDLYLKLAPFGGNLEGVRAATLGYFGKEPGRLTAAQMALLIALPQSPEARRPDRDAVAAEAARNRVLARLAEAGILPGDEARAARREAVPVARAAFPSIAPHLADRMLAAHPAVPRHRLSIERDLQARLEALAAAHVAHAAAGLSAAIIVADHQSGEVLASVGSAGYLDTARQGAVDMTRAIRSPGSTLKPLIYGLAFEAGIAHPDTVIEDRPTAFGTYAPLNFDGRFYGTISLRDALRYSLNIPAVKLLEAVGPAQMLSRMARIGVDAELPGEAAPGLAIALGGLGLRLEDLVRLYGAMANGGQAAALRYRLDEAAAPAAKRLLSAEAAWQVGNILGRVERPYLAPDTDLAFKTGTSYGYRDAWAVGFDGRHVIAVWIGRPDGASVPGISGADSAAPLLFDAFSRLKPKLEPLPPPPPATLIVSNAELPSPLRQFGASAEAGLQGPEIAFPPDGARLDLVAGLPLVVKVRNGTPPFTWITDGVPQVIATNEREVELAPSGRGFVDLSVIDATGRSRQARIEVQ
ncbi:MAG: penicillin-binding protein 1C [Rhodobacteraceae bacterium]|nr:penicillin-binding protein 1C [Paracoccaceae bacterium]